MRPAVAKDAVAIAAVHVAAWRSAYPGILPDTYLARMSVTRQAIGYERAITRGIPVFVAANSRVSQGSPPIVGFVTGAPTRYAMADSEVETLYVLDDWRDQGVGRGLLAAMAHALADQGCRSTFCWVLRDNPSRWFYRRLGGREAATAMVRVAGVAIPQTAFVWNGIDSLFTAAE